MADKKNYYAVKLGVRPGIYRTWDECKKNVHGFKGAIFKGFVTLEEAEEFMGIPCSSSMPGRSAGTGKTVRTEEPAGTGKTVRTEKPAGIGKAVRTEKPAGTGKTAGAAEAVAYVDGSYNISTGEYSYGMVLYHNGRTIEQAEKFDDAEMAAMRNVAGEVEGSMHAMTYCLENGISSIDIYYDYEGIEKWALGMWKTNKRGTIAYKKFYDSVKDKLRVNFHKVKGHSGDLGNDKADRLAKSALGIV